MSTQLTWSVAFFRKTIHAAIPLLVNMLKDGHSNVQSATISVIVKLADHGEFD